MSKESEVFKIALEKVLSVTHEEIRRMEAEEKAKRELAPVKRKTKKKPSVLGPVERRKD